VSRERIKEVLKIVGLEDTGKKTAKKFSLGMKQRLSIALALLPNPELLILDEPANGLDPNGIIELRHLIKSLNKQYGMTIVISSHILAEVEKTVSHLGIIYKGKCCSRVLCKNSIRYSRKMQSCSLKRLIMKSPINCWGNINRKGSAKPFRFLLQT
jgi:ABC-2 type transport system ATP-binding protein